MAEHLFMQRPEKKAGRSVKRSSAQGGVIQRKIKVTWRALYGSGQDEKPLSTLLARIKEKVPSADLRPGTPLYNSIQTEFNDVGEHYYSSYDELYSRHLTGVERDRVQKMFACAPEQTFPPKRIQSLPPREYGEDPELMEWPPLRAASPVRDFYNAQDARQNKTVTSTMFRQNISTTMSGPGRFSAVGSESSYADLTRRAVSADFGELTFAAMCSGDATQNETVQRILRIIFNSEGFGRSMHSIALSAMVFQNIRPIMERNAGKTLFQVMKEYLCFTWEGGAGLSRRHMMTDRAFDLVKAVLEENGIDIEDKEAVENFLAGYTRFLIDSVKLRFEGKG